MLYCTQPVSGIDERLSQAYFEWQEKIKAAVPAKDKVEVSEKNEVRMSV